MTFAPGGTVNTAKPLAVLVMRDVAVKPFRAKSEITRPIDCEVESANTFTAASTSSSIFSVVLTEFGLPRRKVADKTLKHQNIVC